ncbi:MAG: FxsA family protein [Bradymonadaceae bacterium]
MIGKLTLLFSLATAIELALLVQVGQMIGIGATIALILATALVGGILAKQQGLTIWNRIQSELRQGEMPGDSLLDGLAVLIAGAFLLTPGVLTDLVGIGLLIPFVRAPIRRAVKSRAKDWVDSSTVTYVQSQGPASPFEAPDAGTRRSETTDEEDVIDVTPSEQENDGGGDSDEPVRSDLSP